MKTAKEERSLGRREEQTRWSQGEVGCGKGGPSRLSSLAMFASSAVLHACVRVDGGSEALGLQTHPLGGCCSRSCLGRVKRAPHQLCLRRVELVADSRDREKSRAPPPRGVVGLGADTGDAFLPHSSNISLSAGKDRRPSRREG